MRGVQPHCLLLFYIPLVMFWQSEKTARGKRGYSESEEERQRDGKTARQHLAVALLAILRRSYACFPLKHLGEVFWVGKAHGIGNL